LDDAESAFAELEREMGRLEAALTQFGSGQAA
jgi:hypothetical protein